MSSTRIPSLAGSLDVTSITRQRRFRNSRSVGSPACSTTSVKLSSMLQENKKYSFNFSPLPSRRSVLSDNTEIEMPKRRSWWKRLDENSKDVMEFIENREQQKTTNVEELIDAEILSQEKKNYTIDLPESSDGESIQSIVLPQRKLFTQKDQSQKVYKNVLDKRENLERLQKSKINYDNTIDVGRKDLFSKGRERSKPAFPAALLNMSLDKTELNKKDKDISKQGQLRNLFGNRPGTKRKNMFAQFIVSDSEEEISDVQTKVFGFAKNSKKQQPRASYSNRLRETSPTSDTTDVELDDWKLLPSSTMVDNEFGNLESNTPVKKARLSKTMPASEELAKSKSDKVRTSNRSFKNSEKTFKNNPVEDISPNQTLTEDNVQSNNSKTRHVTDEIILLTPIDLPMVHDTRKLQNDENINDFTKTTQNISRNDNGNLQKSEVYVTGEGNHEQIGDIEMERIISEDNDENPLEDEENEDNEENQEECDDIEMSQNISENNDDHQEDKSNEEDPQEGEDNGENQEEVDEYMVDEENREEIDDIETIQNISKYIGKDLQKNHEYEANNDNQPEFSDNEIVQNNKEIRDQVGSIEHSKNNLKNVKNNLQDNEKYQIETGNQEELDKMELVQNITKNNEDNIHTDKEYIDYEEIVQYQSDLKKHDNHEKIEEQSVEREKDGFVCKDTVEGSIPISDEKNKDVVDNQDTNDKEAQTQTISIKDLNRRQRKSHEQENNDVLDYQDHHKDTKEAKNNQTRASNGLNKSQSNDKNKSIDNQARVPNKNTTIHNKTERSVRNQSMINATHDTTGRNRERVELEIKSPEEVRNFIANDMEYISPAGRETSSRKTRSVIKLNELRPSLAPLRESTGISDGTCNSSVERSGWDSHRTTRKTLRQTFGKDFTPRKSLRALVMEKSAKRQTYGFDVTTKVPQACSTRLPENMHDITNDDVIEQQHASEIHVEASEKIPVIETVQDRNKKTNKEKTYSHNVSHKDALEQRHSMGNENLMKSQENNVKSHKADLSNTLNGEKLSSRSNINADEISKDRKEHHNTQSYDEIPEREEVNERVEKSQDDKVQIRDSQDAEVVATNEEMRDSQNEEVEASDEEVQDSQNDEIEESDEEIQDSNDVQEDAESQSRRESMNGEEQETGEGSENEGSEESDQEMRYSEENEGQESEEERLDSRDNEVESEEEKAETEHNEDEESDEGRRYSSQITIEEESDEENVDSQNASRNISKQRYFVNNSIRDLSNLTDESNRDDTLTKRQNIMEILLKVKEQNLAMSRQAEQAVRNSLKRPLRESVDVFKVPLRPIASLRRMKPVTSKAKPKNVKTSHLGVENLPLEVLEDLKYKPPKRYRPSNASWITKRLYKFLETKLEPKYDYKARVRAEKLAETLYEFAKETRRRNVADSNAVDALKNEMARLEIVSTHFEFYQFFHDFMPREIRIKVVPDIVNKISMPKHGIFSNIIR